MMMYREAVMVSATNREFQRFFRFSFLLLSGLVLLWFLPTANAWANVPGAAVVNNSGTTIYVMKAAGDNVHRLAVVPSSSSSDGAPVSVVIPLSQWYASGWDVKHPHFVVSKDPAGKEILCGFEDPKYGTKKSPGIYTVANDFNCSHNHVAVGEGDSSGEVDTEGPPAYVQPPIFRGIPTVLVSVAGEYVNIVGRIDNGNGINGEVRLLDGMLNHTPLSISVSGQSDVSLPVVISGTPGDVQSPTDYEYEITAQSVLGGAQSQPVTFKGIVRVLPKNAEAAIIPRSIAVWLYDASNGASKKLIMHAGQFLENIKAWNGVSDQSSTPTSAGNRITELYTYGTDMEMYEGSLESYYYIDRYWRLNNQKHPGHEGMIYSIGPMNTAYYKDKFPGMFMSPIVDGRTDHGGYLVDFNSLSQDKAEGYADLLAAQFCADHNTDGIQVDVEPLDFVTQSGAAPAADMTSTQVLFYLQLTKNLAGENKQLPICHGKVRYVSVFTFAQSIAKGLAKDAVNTKNRAALMELLQRDNFLVIDSLYDLPAGNVSTGNNDAATYAQYAKDEVNQIVALSAEYGFNFKFGIPASCSFHECDTSQGQKAYVQASLEAIAASNKVASTNICDNPKFKGLAIWAFDNHVVDFKGTTFNIQPPTDDVVRLMTQNGGAAGIIGCSMND